MCLYPKIVPNPKYIKNKKNGGIIPPIIDERVLHVPIGCGNCMECRNKKKREWQVRLQEEIKHSTKATFITLTFSDESIAQLASKIQATGYTLDNAIATKATRMWLERWRKHNKKSLRHWLITELGHNGTKNIHLHGLIWLPKHEQIHQIQDTWKYGHVWLGQPIKKQGKTIDYKNYVNEKTIAYISKYITKIDHENKYYKPVILTSAGIGKAYITKNISQSQNNKYKGTETNDTYKTSTGHKIALPIYYRNKIYNEQERESLWLIKLDQQTRYINGIKIDISQNTDTYSNILKNQRIKNTKLGYGKDQKDWNQYQYEQTQRIIMQQTRIAKAIAKIANKKNKTIEKIIKEGKLPDAPF